MTPRWGLLTVGLVAGLWACDPGVSLLASSGSNLERPAGVTAWIEVQLQTPPPSPSVGPVTNLASAFVPEAFAGQAAPDPFQRLPSDAVAAPQSTDWLLQGLWQDREGPAALIRVGAQLRAWRIGEWPTPDWRLDRISQNSVELSQRVKVRLPQGAWAWQQQKRILSLDAVHGVAP